VPAKLSEIVTGFGRGFVGLREGVVAVAVVDFFVVAGFVLVGIVRAGVEGVVERFTGCTMFRFTIGVVAGCRRG